MEASVSIVEARRAVFTAIQVMKISILIATFNRAELLDRALQSLTNQILPKGIDVELLVIDNNSSDGTRSVIEKWIPRFSFPARYLFEKNQGRSFALNRGIDEAKGDLIYFLDDDVIVDAQWITKMAKAFERYPDAMGFGGRVVPIWPDQVPKWLLISGQRRLKVITPETDMGEKDRLFLESEAPVGCNSAYRRQVFFEDKIRFRTDLGYIGDKVIPGEDTEIAYEVMSKGHSIIYVHDAIVHHPAIIERMTKKYARDRYFALGQAMVRAFGQTKYAELPKIFGVYRYLIKETLEYFSKWSGFLCIGKWGDSFYYEVKCLTNIGMMCELWSRKSERLLEVSYANRD